MAQIQKISNLQIARALAAASVVYFHIAARPTFGSFGVDIFFVLSGFVIAMVVERGESPTIFAANRIARIVPLYWLMTLGVFVVGSLAPSALNSATANAEQLVKSLLFIPFFRANGDLYPLLGVGWSLNYEMFFYACVLIGLLGQRRHWMLITAGLLIAAYLVLGIALDNRVTNGFFGTTRLVEFLFGMLCFQLARTDSLLRFSAPAGAAAAVLAFVWMAFAESNQLGGARALVFGIPSIVLVLGAVRAEELGGRTFARLRPYLVKLGDASYATYLSHYYVVVGFERILHARLGLFDPRTVHGTVIVMASALATGQLLYWAVDQPLHAVCKRKLLLAVHRISPRTPAVVPSTQRAETPAAMPPTPGAAGSP
jgi:exopolysaccharide production protein ExoZ